MFIKYYIYFIMVGLATDANKSHVYKPRAVSTEIKEA